MCNRLDIILACDGQTDGRTDGRANRQTSCHGIVRAMHTRRAVITIKDCARRHVLLKLTTDRHEAARGLFATAQLLVCHCSFALFSVKIGEKYGELKVVFDILL